jgi:hypothetical protein
MVCRPNPLLLRSSAFSCFSPRSFSLLRLSAIRSLKDLILGGSLEEADRDRPPVILLPGRLRLISRAVRPLSMPSSTRAGLLGSSGARRIRTGERGISTSASAFGCGRGSSSLRMPMAVPAREEAPLRSLSADPASLFLCSAFNFNFASMACSFSCSVSSSSSPSLSASAPPRDIGRRFEGDGDTELRSRCLSYFLRADGELRSASTGDCGGQLG